MAKVKIQYPQVIVNTVTLDIPEDELEDVILFGGFEEKFELFEKYSSALPSYDHPDRHLCESYDEIDFFKFEVINPKRPDNDRANHKTTLTEKPEFPNSRKDYTKN